MTFTFKSVLVSLAMFAMLTAAARAQRTPIIEWQQCYGGHGLENSRQFIMPHDHMMIRTSDGGSAFVGLTNSYDNAVTGNHHDTTPNPTFDFWLVKTDASGKIQWEKCYGGSGDESPRCLIQTSDGGFVMCGETKSHDGDVTDANPVGSSSDNMYSSDGWIVKTDPSGIKQWAHAVGWSLGDECLNSIVEVNGDLIAVGITTTVQGALEGHILDSKLNQGDALIVKVNSNGAEQWRRQYGDIFKDEANAVIPIPGDGYLFVGAAGGQGPFSKAWVVKLDVDGFRVWAKYYGDSKLESANCVISIPNGFLVAGQIMPKDWDWNKPGDCAGMVFTIDTAGTQLDFHRFGGPGNDIITSVTRKTDGTYLFAGSSTSPNISGAHIAMNPDTLTHNIDSTDGWVGCFTPGMILLWQKCFGGDFRDAFYGVLEIPKIEDEFEILLYGAAESGNKLDGGNGDHNGNVNGYADAWLVQLWTPALGVAARGLTGRYNAYPNPAPNIVNLDLFERAKVERVQFYDALGAEVFPQQEVTGNSLHANVGQLPAGLYTIRVTYENSLEQVRKFVHAGF